MILYHFTSERHLTEILTSGVIKTTESNLSLEVEHAGPDVVWLTRDKRPHTNRGWSTPVLPGKALEGIRVLAPNKLAVRFVVQVDAIPWLTWAREYNIDPLWRDSLIKSGGNARSWYVTENLIPANQWVAIERPV